MSSDRDVAVQVLAPALAGLAAVRQGAAAAGVDLVPCGRAGGVAVDTDQVDLADLGRALVYAARVDPAAAAVLAQLRALQRRR